MIREAANADISVLAEILHSCPEAGNWSERDFEQCFQPGTVRRCLVAEKDGRLVGFLLAECPMADEAEILTLAVEPNARRQGIATALLDAFLRSRRGHVFLEVRRSNLIAQQLYRTFGFSPAGGRPGYYVSPPEDAIVMRWKSLQ